MAKSNLLIRNYDNIRRILRDIYIFGCYSRDDFIEKGMSGRKYDNEQRRINAYLPEGFIRKGELTRRYSIIATTDQIPVIITLLQQTILQRRIGTNRLRCWTLRLIFLYSEY